MKNINITEKSQSHTPSVMSDQQPADPVPYMDDLRKKWKIFMNRIRKQFIITNRASFIYVDDFRCTSYFDLEFLSFLLELWPPPPIDSHLVHTSRLNGVYSRNQRIIIIIFCNIKLNFFAIWSFRLRSSDQMHALFILTLSSSNNLINYYEISERGNPLHFFILEVTVNENIQAGLSHPLFSLSHTRVV